MLIMSNLVFYMIVFTLYGTLKVITGESTSPSTTIQPTTNIDIKTLIMYTIRSFKFFILDYVLNCGL